MGVLYAEIYAEDPRAHLANPEASYALTCWELSRESGDIPREEVFVRRRAEWLKADMMVLRQIEGGDLLYEAYGANIAAHAGFDMTGKRLSAFQGALYDFYSRTYADVIRNLKPVATVHRLGNYDERPIWERVILPVREAGGGVALHVVNRVRKLQDDVALISSRARGNGVLVVQFRRDAHGVIADAVIAGANAAALRMTGRRLDEVLDKPIRDCFPGVIHYALWERYLQVAETRQEQTFQIDYRLDGLDDLFDVKLYPFRDGVAIDFRVLPRAPEPETAALAPRSPVPA